MKTLLIIILTAIGASAQPSTNLFARVQVDAYAANRGQANALTNALLRAIETNAPLPKRTAPITVSDEPRGGFRIHALLEFATFEQATNCFKVVKAEKNPNVSGRILIYCQPDDFTTLTDWAGADADRRAKRTEETW